MRAPNRSHSSTTLAAVRRPEQISQARRREDDGRVRPGDIVDEKYRVEGVLGEGGMGYVVSARHLHLDQKVALKFMHQAIVTRDSKRRLLREARSVAGLRSRHVARVLDLGTHRDGTPYIVMEHLEGIDLCQLVEERGALPPRDACEYVMQACEALAEAHARGIIHRDLKLGNLFLTRGFGGEPVVKVLDFGVSKAPEHGDEAFELTQVDGASHDDALTQATDVLGSPRFMAPEQLLGARHADAQSDVWSLGVILFALLTGHLPFLGESIGELVQQIVRGPIPDVRAVRPDLPQGLDHVVARCLARERNERARDCLDLVRLLAPYVHRAVPSAERIALVGQAFARAALVPSSIPPPPPPPSPPPSLPAPGSAGPLASAPPSAQTLFWLAVLALSILCLATVIAVVSLR